VPFDKWERLRDLLTDPTRTMTKGSNNAKYLLTGVMRCGLCGGRMAGTINRQADPVEELLLEAIFQAVESPAWGERVRQTSSDDEQVQKLLERRATVSGLLDRLEDKVARELITEPAYKRNRMELEDELEGISRQLDRLQDSSIVPAVPRNLRDVWQNLAFDRQRAIVQVVLRAVGRRLVVYPQNRSWPFDPSSVRLEETPV